MCLLPANHGDEIKGTPLSDAGRLCLDRRAFLIVDPPAGWTDIQTAVDGMLQHELTGTEFAKSAAVYFPRLTIQNPSPTSSVEIQHVAPSGAVAGIYARTDTARGVWKAPAGTEAGFAGVNSFSLR